jgi:hypothetical protein
MGRRASPQKGRIHLRRLFSCSQTADRTFSRNRDHFQAPASSSSGGHMLILMQFTR